MAHKTEIVSKELARILTNLGLTPNELRVFSFLLARGAGLKATEISARVRLNRTTLYGVLRSLVSRGLISSSETRGVLVFQSIQPHLLVDHIERSREQLARDALEVKKLLPALEDARSQQEGYRPFIKFFDGTEGIKQVYEDLMVNNNEKTVYGFTGAQAAWGLMSTDWIDYVLKKRPAMGVKWLAVSADQKEMREIAKHDVEQLRITKFLPGEYMFDVELIAYDDKTGIISFSAEHPWAALITDEKIATTVKAIFKYVDSTLPYARE